MAGKSRWTASSTAEMTRSGLRRNFGMVLQDTWLFGGTVAENIAYGKPDATREEIVAAAKAAKVDYFIRTMPQGYDTVLDNEAANLSAGQRQLLTIARVFLCDPAHPDPGRGHLQRGYPYGGGDRQGHETADGRPNQLCHRPPPFHHPGCGQHPVYGATATSSSRGITKPCWQRKAPTPPSTTANLNKLSSYFSFFTSRSPVDLGPRGFCNSYLFLVSLSLPVPFLFL